MQVNNRFQKRDTGKREIVEDADKIHITQVRYREENEFKGEMPV